jgi:hypothetical protein
MRGSERSRVAQEVNRAALPGAAMQPRDRRLQTLVSVGDDQPHAGQAAGEQRAQKIGPERLGLGLAHVDAEDLGAARLVHAVGDDYRLAHHAAAVPDLLDLAVQPQASGSGNHPLIDALYRGERKKADLGKGGLKRTKGPSYISPRAFALFVIDAMTPSEGKLNVFKTAESTSETLPEPVKRRLQPLRRLR